MNWDFIQSCFFCLTILTTIGQSAPSELLTELTTVISRLREFRSLDLRGATVLFDIRDGGDPLHALRIGRCGRADGRGHRVHLAVQQTQTETSGGETSHHQTKAGIRGLLGVGNFIVII